MNEYNALKDAIRAAIKPNGEYALTAQVLQNILIAIVNSFGKGYQFMGIATAETEPGEPDEKEFYVGFAGEYANFVSETVTVPVGGVVIFIYDTEWHANVVKLAERVAVSGNHLEIDGARSIIEQDIVNVNTLTSQGEAFLTAAAARAAVSAESGLRIGGQVITYLVETDEEHHTAWVVDQYTGDDAEGWENDDNWQPFLYVELAKIISNQAQINEAVMEALGNRYTKEQIDGMIEPLSERMGAAEEGLAAEILRAQAAESRLQDMYEGLTQNPVVIGPLPSSGQANTIYRVPGTSSYSDYMWDGTQFVLMATYSDGRLDFINVNLLNATDSTPHAAYASAAAARADITAASGLRALGLQITYLLTDGVWYTDQYIGTDISGWTDVSNWKTLGPVTVTQNTTTGKEELKIGNDVKWILDDEPTAKSNNLVKSGGVYKEIKTKVIGLNEELQLESMGVSLVPNPARTDGTSSLSGFFAGYEVDLSGLYPKYNFIFFRGASFEVTSTISPGIVLDGNNNIESSVAPLPQGNGWYMLPITANSVKLWATYCKASGGGEVWTPEYVEARAFEERVSDVIQSFSAVNKDVYGVELPISSTGQYIRFIGGIGGSLRVEVDSEKKYIRYPIEEGDLLLINTERLPPYEAVGMLDSAGKVISLTKTGVRLIDYIIGVAGNAKEIVINLPISFAESSFIFKRGTLKNTIESSKIEIPSLIEEVGILPINKIAFVENPARNNGTSSTSGNFAGYQIDLTGLYPKYKFISFCGTSFGTSSTIVKGIIIDTDGNLESFISPEDISTGWRTLPITEKSAKLWATYPSAGSSQTGVDRWVPQYVIARINNTKAYEIPQSIEEFAKVFPSLEDNTPILPSEIHAVAGERVLLFKNAVIPGAVDSVAMKCTGGRDFRRYLALFPSSAGNIQLSVSVNNAIASSQIKVVSPSNPSSVKNVLIVGASTTANYQNQFEELYRRIVLTSGDANITYFGASIRNPHNPRGLGLTNVAFVGRLTNGQNFRYEATGGYSWENYYGTASFYGYAFIVSDTSLYEKDAVYSDGSHDFIIYEISGSDNRISAKCNTPGINLSESGTLTKVSGGGANSLSYTSYSETLNRPFLNPSTLQTSLQYYMNTYCGGRNLDIIYFNGLIFNTGYDFTQLENYAKPLFRVIHSEYPNAKILVGSGALNDTSGNGLAYHYNSASITGRTAEANRKLREYIKKIDSLCSEMNAEFSATVCIPSCLALQADSDYDYPSSEKDVDNRNTQTEKIGTNGNHPTNVGILNHIDAIYRSICYIIATYFN